MDGCRIYGPADSVERIRNVEELVPVVEADELAYLELSEQDAELLIHV